jgi:hypothetical protein
MLTEAQRKELERNGVANVRLKLSSFGGGRRSELTGAYEGEPMTRGDVEDWLAEQAEAEQKTISSTLFWARVAGVTGIISLIIALVALVK